MNPLPQDFLNNIADEYLLSPEQKEVFVALYLQPNKNIKIIASEINRSLSACTTRMTGVYEKFSFSGNGKNKRIKLYTWLTKQLSQSQLSEQSQDNNDDRNDIEQLVNKIRQQTAKDIKKRCGKMQVLDMTQSIGLDDIYTQVNILQSITDSFRYSIKDLMDKCNLNELERFNFGKIKQKRVSGLTAVKENPQMMIWGKPGSGKTTFLKYIAIQCLGNKLLGDHVPIFITLKDFADNCSSFDLLTYLQTQGQQQQIETDDLQTILTSGKALILLDGLDEVRQEYCRDVINQIDNFVNRFSLNNFLITCRIAAREYIFNGFQQVEIADFDLEQINTFVGKWYGVRNPVKSEKFLEKLANNEPIQELASNPLLLTLLCLVFETNTDFPISRSELYEEGVDVLLKKWDATRNIERDMVYKKLSLKRKEDLLSHLAEISFTKGNYFFKQKDAEEYISQFIRNLPDAKTDPEALLLDSRDVLKSIQSQHGLLVERAKKIFSFSHLTFHEYFTARQIASQGKEALPNLVSHLTEPRWREVFLLVFEIISNTDHADYLVRLMKQTVDELVKNYPSIQILLSWAKNKANLIRQEILKYNEVPQRNKQFYNFYTGNLLFIYVIFDV